MKLILIYLLIGTALTFSAVMYYLYMGCPDEEGNPGEFNLGLFNLIIGIILWPVVVVMAIMKWDNDDMTLGGNY